MSKEKSIQQLIARYLNREPLDKREKERLKVWLAEPANRRALEERMKGRPGEPEEWWAREDGVIDTVDEIAHWNQFMRLLEARGQSLVNTGEIRKQRLIERFGYAAAGIVFILVGTELAWLVKKVIQTPNSIYPSVSFVSPPANPAPGGSHATLALSDGRSILLDSVAIGETLSESGRSRVAKTGEGVVSFIGVGSASSGFADPGSMGPGSVGAAAADSGPRGSGPGAKEAILNDAPYPATKNTNQWNVLSTPRGGIYSAVLPDGSRVWLNAASSIRFPAAFGARRVVEITGEAYFEIARDAGRPFVVQAGDRSVDVLGTSFNVNAYHDEPVFAVSLAEGKVRVQSERGRQETLLRGQQARVAGGEMQVRDRVNMKAVLSWKDGYFKFDKTNLSEVMRSIGRWYDADIVYEGAFPEDQFTGTLDRKLPLERNLLNLEGGRVYLRIDRVNGRRKIVIGPAGR